jgi:hypothetical protein
MPSRMPQPHQNRLLPFPPPHPACNLFDPVQIRLNLNIDPPLSFALFRISIGPFVVELMFLPNAFVNCAEGTPFSLTKKQG